MKTLFTTLATTLFIMASSGADPLALVKDILTREKELLGPEATVAQNQNSVTLAYQTRTFTVHMETKLGYAERTRERVGPTSRGLLVKAYLLDVAPGPGAALFPRQERPREQRHPYWYSFKMEQSTPKKDQRLIVDFLYGADADRKTLERLISAIDGLATAEDTPDDHAPIRIFFNPTRASCREGTSCPITTTLVNVGTNTVYLRSIDALTANLYHPNGERVEGKLVQDPGPPPPHFYMRVDDGHMLMMPAHELPPGKGIAFLANDPRMGYDDLPAGSYLTGFDCFTLELFSPDQVVLRDETEEKMWIRADARPVAAHEIHPRKVAVQFTD